jgi:serine/threonine protein kinase
MAEVWLGSQTTLNREVAIKILSETSSVSQELRLAERFEREAHSIASLDHPGILPVIDYGRADGLLYLVMPYVRGGSLQDYLKRELLTRAQAFRIFEQVLAGLGYAHRKGIVHRDLKPANILLYLDGRAVIADFGVAKTLSENVSLTQTGSAVGSPQYMAPEQFMGQADFRSDLYSMGVILYQLLTGKLLYSGTTSMEIALKHLNDPLPLPDPLVPTPLELFLQRALSKKPEMRFGSAEEMANAFHQAISYLSPQDLQFRPPRPVPNSRVPNPLEHNVISPMPSASYSPTVLPTTPIPLTGNQSGFPPTTLPPAMSYPAYGTNPGQFNTPTPFANTPPGGSSLTTPPPANWTTPPPPPAALVTKKSGVKVGIIAGLIVALLVVASAIGGYFLLDKDGSKGNVTTTPASVAVATNTPAVTAVGVGPGVPSLKLPVNAQNGTKISGTLTIAANADGTSIVTVTASGLEPGTHHSHIHNGSCVNQGAVIYPLNDLVAGADGNATVVTKLNVNFATLTAGNLSFNIHNEPGTPTYVAACSDIIS